MKWLAGLLLLLNAALFLWATGHDPAGPTGASPYPVVNAEAMRLLSEVREDSSSEADAGLCARIGPFVDSAVMAVAAQKLDALSLPYTRRTVKAREIRAFRVYLGPFQSQSAVEAQNRLLEAAGVEDYYVKDNEEDGGQIISLGLFSQRDGAQVLRQRMLRRDVRAKLRTEDRVLESNFWLEIDDPAIARDIPEALTEARWGEKDARVRQYDCP